MQWGFFFPVMLKNNLAGEQGEVVYIAKTGEEQMGDSPQLFNVFEIRTIYRQPGTTNSRQTGVVCLL